MLGRLVNNELEKTRKGAVVMQFHVVSWDLHGGNGGKARNTSVGLADVPSEIRNRHLQNASKPAQFNTSVVLPALDGR